MTVAAGADSSADITVVSPASNPTPNAVALGVGGNSAFSTGDFIHLNSSPTVLIFGQGISANMNITISGPGDIQVSNLTTIKAQDNTPGVSFTATVPGNAALGARTVMLKDANNDITTFTGSLEVVP